MRFKLPPLQSFRNLYFLLLLPLFFVWHGYLENHVSVTISEILFLFGQYLLAIALLLMFFYLLFGHVRKAALFVFLLMSFYFFFGALHDAAKSVLGKTFLVSYSFILPFSLLFFITAAILLKRTRREFNKLFRFLNLLFIILILADIPLLVRAIQYQPENRMSSEFLECKDCNKPDIYLILADEYAGQQELKELFGFDNSAFISQLKNRGFHVVENSRSNYNFTPFSMASMLSMSYLENIEGRNSSKADMNLCSDQINSNDLWNFLKVHGYTIINNSIFSVDDKPTREPQKLLFTGIKLITSQTFISRFNYDIRFNLVTRFRIRPETRRITYLQKHTNERVLERVRKEARSKKNGAPRFIYTHLMMPHYPFYFDSAGKERSLDFLADAANYKHKEAYVEYLHYSNRIFLDLIDQIRSQSKNPPVIILMSDHGFRLYDKETPNRYRFMNFNSIYLPSLNYDGFYPGMSNVNQFRVLLNTLFKQELPVLKDSVSLLIE